MGNCCSNDARYAAFVGSDMSEMESEEEVHDQTIEGDDGSLVKLAGSSNFVSMYSKKGTKGINQDALTVWEGFAGEKDMVFCGVFDGHGSSGHKVSRFVRDHLPVSLSEAIKASELNGGNMSQASWKGSFLKSFKEADEELAQDYLIDTYCSGSTAVTVVKQGDSLIIGNLGDSRAVLCTRENKQLVPVQLTVDQKPNLPSEAKRIISSEGRVFAEEEEPDVYRIWMPDEDIPGLAMARSFGDFCLKDYGVISTPEIFYRKITKNDEFVVLASDGVWDALTNTEVVDIVASVRRPSMAAKILVKHAVKAWQYKYPKSLIDDITVVCLFLKNQPTLMSSSSKTSKFAECRSEQLVPESYKSIYSQNSMNYRSSSRRKEELNGLQGLIRANSMKMCPDSPVLGKHE